MRNIDVQGNVKSRKFAFFVQEFRMHWLYLRVINDLQKEGPLIYLSRFISSLYVLVVI